MWEQLSLAALGLFLLGLGLNDLRAMAPSKLSEQGNTWAASQLAYIDGPFTPTLDQHFRFERRQRASISLGLGAVLVVLAITQFTQQSGLLLILWSLIIFFGTASTTGSVVSTARIAADLPVGSAAHSRAVCVGDYAPLLMRASSVIAGAGSAVTAVWLLSVMIWTGWTWSLVVIILLAVLVAAAAVIAEWAARTIAETPQRAKDAAHLYWQDALRSNMIKQAYVGVPLWAGQVLIQGGIAIYAESPPFMVPLGFALVVVSAVSALSATSLRFRARLWPTLAPGQVLMPGDLPPPKSSVSGSR